MIEVTENLIVKRKHGWQAEVRVDMGEAQILIIVGSSGQIEKKTKDGRSQDFYSDRDIEAWGRPCNVEMTMSMNGTAVFQPNDWAELMLIVRTAKRNLGQKIYEEAKKK
jgi:hypothetical protein